MTVFAVEVDVPGLQGPAGPAGTGADPATLRGGSVPPLYNEATQYTVGSRVTYQDLEYTALVETVAGTFVVASWKEVSIQALEARIVAAEAAILELQGVI